MSAADGWRAFALRGARHDVEAAVAFLHVHADVQGVLEEGDGAVVWLLGQAPALPAALAVEVEERAVTADEFTVTGLERDAAILVADDLLVRPPWVARPAGFDGVELVVPRGNAFGSGEHDSTQAALRLLHRTWAAPASLADVGCGSGILARYAQVRGCGHVEACDIDAPSVVTARELLPGARVEVGGAELLAPCEAVVANMTGTELGGALDAILALWRGPGPLVRSGMRAHEVDGLVARVPGREVDREVCGAFTGAVFVRGDQAVR